MTLGMFRNPLNNAQTATAGSVDALEAGRPVTRLQLIPIGKLHLRDGRKFELADEVAAASVIDLTRRYLGRADMMIDYDHHSESAGKTGARAEAAGWIATASLQVENGFICGDVEWTAQASAALEERRYRYLSPTFFFDKANKVMALKSAGLVNIPAIDELAAVASTQETVMLNQIALKVGLPETATLEEILAALDALQPAAPALTAMAAALSTAATGLGLAADAAVPDVLAAAAVAAAATASEPDATKFVPIEQLTAVNAELVKLRTASTATAATAAVDDAIAKFKIAPGSRAHFIKSAEQDLPAFVALAATMPAILNPDETVDTTTKTGAHGLTEAELSMCSTMGVTPEQFLKAKDA